jgi:hypothetical protein
LKPLRMEILKAIAMFTQSPDWVSFWVLIFTISLYL